MRKLGLSLVAIVIGILGYVDTAVAQPTLQSAPAGLTFQWVQGGPTPAPQQLNVTSLTGSQISFTDSVSSGSSLFAVNVSSGTTPATITVSVIASELPLLKTVPGSAGGYISIQPSTGTVLLVQVTLNVTAAPSLTLVPTSLTFNYQIGQAIPAGQNLTLTSNVTATLPYSVTISYPAGAPSGWLAVSPTTGTTPGAVSVSLIASALSTFTAGQYQATLDIASSADPNVVVTLNVGGGPLITGVLNNYSYTLTGLPNYGIAPGALFDIFGTDLTNTPNTAEAFPLNTILNGVSATVEVNGTITQPTLYFVTPTQIAAVLPEKTPVGNGTITVTNNDLTSAQFPIVVVQSDFGILTLNGAGTGPAAAFDIDYAQLTNTHTAHPGAPVIFWGTGTGPDPKNDDRTVPQNPDNLTDIPLQVFIGGLPATTVYKGRNTWPGVDTIVVNVPDGVSPGCNVSVVMQSGGSTSSQISNSSTFPVAPVGSDNCSDPAIYPGGNPPSGDGTYTFGNLSVSQITNLNALAAADRPAANPSQTPALDEVGALFAMGNFSDFLFYVWMPIDFDDVDFPLSLNSCSVSERSSGTTPPPPVTGLNLARSVAIEADGVSAALNPGSMAGTFSTQLADLFPLAGGSLTFTLTGAVPAFTVPVNVPTQPPAVTDTNIDRSAGFKYITSWGGATQGYTAITVSSIGPGSSTPTVSATCLFPASATADVIGAQALLAVPPGLATLTVNYIVPGTFTVSGVDFGFTSGSNAIIVPVTLK